jgi:hypothetical protein
MGKFIHGHAKRGKKTSEWYIWKAIKLRCGNPKTNAYPDYGGRGINICERWSASFLNFLEDMGERPSTRHSIDRIDVNGNYEPTNCRWALPLVQVRNRRIKSNNTSGCEGVSWIRTRNKWAVYIRVPEKRIFLGYFDNLDGAVSERKLAELKYWGKSS